MTLTTHDLGLGLMGDEEIGQRLRDRRIRMGISVRQLADRAGVDRGILAKLEAGSTNVRVTTISKVDEALSRLEHEMGMEDQRAPDVEGRMVEWRISGNFGVDVVVKGPVDDLAALEESVSRIVSRMQDDQRDDPPRRDSDSQGT